MKLTIHLLAAPLSGRGNMNPGTKTLLALTSVALAIAAPITSAGGQQRVTVYADEAPYSTEETMTYEASCPSGKYRLRFNQYENRLEFDGPARTAVDLATTPFGETFLGKALHGKFYSTCPKDGIRIYFHGIEPKEGATLKTVKFSVTFGSDGVFMHGGEVVDEAAEVTNYAFLRKLEQ